MSNLRKRKTAEDEDDYSAGIENEISKLSHSSCKKNTIDSDEEIEDDEVYNKRKYDIMNVDDIEGQEEGTADCDGETRITRFNMTEEMEEGYFDGNGMYIWNKKDANELKDTWLDSIDWVHVKKIPEAKQNKPEASSFQSVIKEKFDLMKMYSSLLEYLRPGETILKCIKRLGDGKQLTASEKLKQKKLARAGKSTNKDANEMTSAKYNLEETEVSKLTEAANKIMILTGNMDIYQGTFESVTFKISKKSVPVTQIKDDEDKLDMFSDDMCSRNNYEEEVSSEAISYPAI